MTPIDSTQATPERTMPVDGEPQPGTDTTASSPCPRADRPPEDLAEPDLTENARPSSSAAISSGTRPVRSSSPRGGSSSAWRIRLPRRARLRRGAGGGARSRFYTLMSQRMFLPTAVPLQRGPRERMLSACFVLPVEDSVESIYDAVKATALIQAGGGTGFNFSKVREAGDRVEGTGGHGAGR